MLLDEANDDELFGMTDSSSYFEILNVLIMQSFPAVISYFLHIGGNFITLFFAGFYSLDGDNNIVFAGISLASMFANVSCLSILVGMSGALETLGSQHNGSGNYEEVGFALQRSIFVLGILTIPIMILWYYTSDLFYLLNIDEKVCTVIRCFIRIRTLSVPIDVVSESYENYLMSIGVVYPSMISSIASNFILLALNIWFVGILKLDYEYLAWSTVISMYCGAIVQIIISLEYPSVKRTLQPLNRKALNNLTEFICLGVPGTIMICSEWWAYEILAVFASLIGTAEVAAQSIIFQMISLSFMIPMGIGITSSSLVGNALGASKTNLAIKVGKVSIYFTLTIEFIVALALIFGGNCFVGVFTSDTTVKKYTSNAMPFLSLFVIVDGIQGVTSAVLRGTGKLIIGAVTNFVAFYVIGLPMAWCFCFTLHMSINGLMLGLSCGTLFQVLVLLILLFIFQSYVYTTYISLENAENDFFSTVNENSKADDWIKKNLLFKEDSTEKSILLSNKDSVKYV
jgi:MATE family multidrug resistance protein